MKLLVATLTPFDADGRVDLGRLRAHVLQLRLQGVDGFVPTAAAGELPYLGDREREAVHRAVIDAAGDLPVYPCTYDARPATMQYLTEAARDAGAAGVLVPPPLFYAVEDDVVRRWYGLVRDLGVPVLCAHDPARFPTRLSSEQYAALRADGLAAGMVDGAGDPFRLRRLAEADPGRVFSASDRALARAARVPDLAGIVSSIANAWPTLVARIVKNGATDLDDAVADRVQRIRHAGGLRALKALLDMGCRMPLPAPEPSRLAGLPAADRP